jgi:hypothetical protein
MKRVWQNEPADWDENISKCKMSPVEGESNAWSIKLIPTKINSPLLISLFNFPSISTDASVTL